MFDLDTLAAYTKSRNHLVKHVVLELNLDRYTWTPTPSEGCFLKTAQTLFKILSTWDGHGITLEFAILSHEEVYFTYSEDHSIYAIPRQPRAQSTFAQYKQYFELPQEMLFGGYLADSEAAWHRKVSLLVGRRSLGFLFSQFKYTQLQVVNCISKLLIRRRYFPNIAPISLARIMDALPCLESVHIERWCFGAPEKDAIYDMGFPNYLRVPRSCKNISFYEEDDTDYHRRVMKRSELAPNASLANSLGKEAHHLENIAVSFSFDAVSFFTPRWGHDFESLFTRCDAYDFKELKTLALTSPTMVSEDYGVIDHFLCTAAKSAERMPKLETLELWYFSSPSSMPPHPTPSCAGIFTYQRLDRYSSCISLKSTQTFKISGETRERWKGVVDVEGAEFSVEHLDLDPDQLTSIGKLYPYLALRGRILNGITWTEA
ncbi:unnamed protein product [Fusarium graminearum]|uniref:DUF6546 domain-containing protein n=1 Tax=Gibberella zeae TaxID=5518 RepID=A0A9N8RB87_GIBZA|nr:unnamed protein product [Fusarium graminearum]